jgi:hypothetical protein
MFSRIVAAPFVFLGLLFLYLAWEVDDRYALYLIPCALSLAIIFVFSPQIDWWWWKKRPPALDPHMRMLLVKYHTLYQTVPPAEKEKFRNRVALFMRANDFKSQGSDAVPEDVKGVIAANAVHLTFGLEEFLFPKFETIVVYAHPFPSPQYPQKEHVSELYEEDGVLLFSAEQLMIGFSNPRKHYNIGMHEYAHAFVLSHPEVSWPDLGDQVWASLERISGFTKDYIDRWINRPDVELLPAAIVHYFTFPESFGAALPDLKRFFDDVFVSKPIISHNN